MSCTFLCLIRQRDEGELALHFLPAADSRGLEKKPGRTKKLWIGLGLLLAAASVAILTGLLVWHFHRELPSVKLYFNNSIVVSTQTFDTINSEITQLFICHICLTANKLTKK